MSKYGDKKRTLLSRTLSTLLVAGSLVWLAWLFWSDTQGNINLLIPKNYYWLLLAIFLGVISQLHNGLLFWYLLRLENTDANFPIIAKLFFSGQIVRHLPGRIWGIFYQFNNAPDGITKKKILLANMEMTFTGIGALIAVSGGILLYHFDKPLLAIFVFFLSIVVISIVLNKGWVDRILEVARKILRRPENHHKGDGYPPLSLKRIGTVLLILLSNWLIYILAWITIGRAGYGGNAELMVVLTAAYSISWLIGYLSMITPSGLGVREASFALLAQDIIPAGDIVALALFARVWLLALDLLLYFFYYPVPTPKEPTHAR